MDVGHQDRFHPFFCIVAFEVPRKALKHKGAIPEGETANKAVKAEDKNCKAEPAEGKKCKAEPGGQLVATVKEEKMSPQKGRQQKQQEHASEAVKLEAEMDKRELVELHGLEVLPRDSNAKRHPIKCSLCNGQIFEGRNRAKVWQHVSGLEHRRRWAEHRQDGGKKEADPDPLADAMAEAADGLVVSDCKGLRLGSSFGQQTRLGTDLLPVWQTYVKFANLEVSSGPGGQAPHEITSLHTTSDWIIRSCSCRKTNVQVLG